MARNRVARPGEINGDVVDRFTFAHAGAGVALGAFGAPWWVALIVAVGWEIVENPLKDRFPRMFPHPTHDRLANAAGDAVAMMVGWGAARAIRTEIKRG